MPVYLVINKESGIVENAIKWDGESAYDPGADYDLEQVSGEPGCAWIGWKRDGGELRPPVMLRYAVVRKLDGLVVDFKILAETVPPVLDEPASFEYALAPCPNEDVQPGWTYSDGEFTA